MENSTLEQIRKGFAKGRLRSAAADLILRQCASEAWFSDALAWLLDPHGSHGWRRAFVDAFLRKIAEERSSKKRPYAFGSTYLKSRLHRPGRGAQEFSLGNAAVVREFLIGDFCESETRHRAYCDVVLLDLDPRDGLFVAIENKLFTSNSPGQLEDYHRAVNNRFKSTPTREFVYLTLFPRDPVSASRRDHDEHVEWVRLSWCRDILGILNALPPPARKSVASDATRLMDVLRWMKSTTECVHRDLAEDFRRALVEAAADCLLAVLAADCKVGTWELKGHATVSRRIGHSSNPTRHLRIQSLPNLTVIVTGTRRRTSLFPKTVVPFGAHHAQVKNLLFTASQDIYKSGYFRSHERYHNANPQAGRELDRVWQKHEPLFRFCYEHAAQLQILMASLACWAPDPDDDDTIAVRP